MKIKESQLRKMIKEALEEYRGNDLGFMKGNKDVFSMDGDYGYIRPGEKIPRTSVDYDKPHEIGKRSVTATVGDHEGLKSKQYDFSVNRGKAKLIYALKKEFENLCEKRLGINPVIPKAIGKIEWTEKELNAFQNVYFSLQNLQDLTKVEGNKKRGYLRDAAEE